MRLLLPVVMSLIFCFLNSFSNAQNIHFELADPQPDILDVYGGSFASGDIDGDGDNDFLISGLSPGRATALYLNDGEGNFTEEMDIPFPDASETVSYFADLDGDNDLDLFFSGWGLGVEAFAHVYLNDGSGVFTQQSNTEILQFRGPGADLADVDGDGDLDLFISASIQSGNDTDFFAELYLNDGNANFSLTSSSGINPHSIAAVKFLDADGDSDMDLFISGETEEEIASSELYLNDGNGVFSLDAQNDFIQMHAADVDAVDIDNDGDVDLLMSGSDQSFEIMTLLYLNNGDGLFSILENTGIQNTFAGANAIADLDNDGDQDIVTLGSQDGGLPNIYNIIYENLGDNNFAPSDTIGGEYISTCTVADFNGDELKDVIVLGFVDDTNVYWNSSVSTSLLDREDGLEFKLYPNPTSDRLILDFNGDFRVTQYEILDQFGRVLRSGVINSEISPLNLRDLSAGMYSLRLFNGKVGVKKFIKE
jgi:hypothetical protein